MKSSAPTAHKVARPLLNWASKRKSSSRPAKVRPGGVLTPILRCGFAVVNHFCHAVCESWSEAVDVCTHSPTCQR